MDWNNKTAANVKAIKPSGIRKFFDIAAQVKGVLSLSIGEPDFAAPDKVLDAMKASLDAKETSYTGNSGMMELREAISQHFEMRYGVHYDPKDEKRMRMAELSHEPFTTFLVSTRKAKKNC